MKTLILVLLVSACGGSVLEAEPIPVAEVCATTVHVGDDISGHWEPYRDFKCATWDPPGVQDGEFKHQWSEQDPHCWCHPDYLKDGACTIGVACTVEFDALPIWGTVH